MEKEIKKSNYQKTVIIISSAIFALALLLYAIFLSLKEDDAELEEIQSSFPVISESESSQTEQSNEISQEASLVFNESEETSYVNEESETVSEILPEHGWVINEYGYTYIYGDCGYEQFNYKSTALERYVNSLNNVANTLPENIRLFTITVPVSTTFADIPREIYVNDNFYNQSQTAFVSTVGSKLNERFISVPIVETLEEKYDANEYVFFRTDKNWTSLGAYYAYRQFCEKADFAPHSLENHTVTDSYEYLGSFYSATKAPEMSDNPDSLICYGTIPSVKTSVTVYDSGMLYTNYTLCNNPVTVQTAYNVFLGRTAPRYEISTTATGGSLLIIGDSSAHPLVSFLASHYSKIDIIDPRSFDKSAEQFLSEHNYDDCIVICYSTNSISGNFIPLLNTFFGGSNE